MMKNYSNLLLVFLAFTFVFFSACKKDKFDFELSYDGSNVTAPELFGGTYESGALFPAGFDGNEAGNLLAEIEYYILELPRTAELRIYSGGNQQPDSLIYSKPVLGEINQGSWNTHVIADPLVLDGENLWVMLSYEQNDFTRTLGCDAGPADENGDWHYDGFDNAWFLLNNETDIDINWNIRAKVNSPGE